MLIFSFDAGIKNLGVCVLQVMRGTQYTDLINQLRILKTKMLSKTTELNMLHHMPQSEDKQGQINFAYTILHELKLILQEIQELLPLFMQIKFILRAIFKKKNQLFSLYHITLKIIFFIFRHFN